MITMVAGFIGNEAYRRGMPLKLDRHAYAMATTDCFFEAFSKHSAEPQI
ncbi:MAG: hypothetical protein QM681_04770 [Novosphingobium sp.]